MQTAVFCSAHCSTGCQHSFTRQQPPSNLYSRLQPRRKSVRLRLVTPPQAVSSALALDIGSPSNFQAITNIVSATLLGIGVWWYLKTQVCRSVFSRCLCLMSALFQLSYPVAAMQNNNEGQQSCPKCRGTGVVECICKRWSDNGKMDAGCGTCGGSGKMVCNACNGGGTAVPIEARVHIEQRRQIKDPYLPAQRQHTCRECGRKLCESHGGVS